MYYYEVLVGDSQFHGHAALTYSAEQDLARGQIVRIALRSRSVLGIISACVAKPSFSVKPISAVADTLPIPNETLQLLLWLQAYYPAPFGVIIRQFLPPTTAFPKDKTTRDPTNEKRQTKNDFSQPPLTPEQKEALSQITVPGSYLLHGVTGSGKTRLYQEVAQKCLTDSRSVIVLTPEIGLTEHLIQAFADMPFSTYVLHSRLTVAARRDIWYHILNAAEPVIVIGPRSALFTPVKNVGAIIMDEAHDQAYKSDAAPHYRTDRVAAKLANLHSALFIEGTATPNVEDYYVFTAKGTPIIRMQNPALEAAAKKTHLVDMRGGTAFGRSRIITTPLLQAMQTALESGEQSLLFLNRRGTAAAILCSSCGWRASCEHCDLPLTYHADKHQLHCHICGRKSSLPSSCPDCNAADIELRTIGTKAVVEEVQRLFPAARIKRFDTDTADAEQIEKQLSALKSGETDIITGTQMITKGLDLPKLSVVGILNADSSLMLPDYTAAERTYQLLAQVVGRVGRGHRDGTVYLQTFNPENPTLVAALSQDWDGFYARELAERQKYRFPPFCYLLTLTCLRATNASAEKAATTLKQQIENDYPKVIVEGPASAFHPRESGKYKWQLSIKSASRQRLLDIIHALPSGWQHNIDPTNLL